jgi:tetratricopeptide (TPR) repeat protein
MIIRLSKVVVKLLAVSLLLYSTNGIGDQSDSRLDDLFDTLKNSQSSDELTETEATIWTIWYESGRDEIDVLMEQGGRAAQAGELAIAESLYTQVVEQAPEFSEGWNRRATIRFYRKNYEDSLEDIKHTLYLEPRHFGAFWGLGMILGSKRDFSAAIAAFERLLEIKPHASDARWRIEKLREEMARSAV